MQLIRGVHNLRPAHRGCVATIGNFDGVHRGHQRILERVVSEARARKALATVMLFEPQPQEFFLGDDAPARLMNLRDKVLTLARHGVDQVLCVRFNDAFRNLDAEAFVGDILVNGLAVEYLVVGDDFRFGRGRVGDFAYLEEAGARLGFQVCDTATCQVTGERVSSTRLRSALAAGDLALAEQLLGRPYDISGRVRHGDKIGRTLQVPTVNLALKRQVPPLQGVFAVTVDGPGLKAHPGAANIGTRPTVNGVENRLEVHLLDFQGDLYGAHLTVHFHHFVRPEEKFGGLDELKAAIMRDLQQVETYFQGTS